MIPIFCVIVSLHLKTCVFKSKWWPVRCGKNSHIFTVRTTKGKIEKFQENSLYKLSLILLSKLVTKPKIEIKELRLNACNLYFDIDILMSFPHNHIITVWKSLKHVHFPFMIKLFIYLIDLETEKWIERLHRLHTIILCVQ